MARRISRRFRMTAIVAEIILGYLTFTGSLIAAGKLQEFKWIPQRPWVYRGQIYVNLGAFALAVLLGLLVILTPDRLLVAGALRPDHHAVAQLRLDAGDADRRRRHAHRDFDLERLCRSVRGGDGIRARQQAADHRRGAGRFVRFDPVDHHVQGHEPLVHECAVRRLRTGADVGRPARRRRPRARRPRARPRSWSRPVWW